MKNKPKDIVDFKLWFILFISLNFIFAFYHFIFFWGNHDWDWVKGTTQVLQMNTGMFEGRYAKFILNVGLFGGQILPILNNMMAFALLSLGGMLLTSYWQLKKFTVRLLIVLIPLSAPYILGWLYFPINILGNFSAVALVAYGLIAAEKDKMPYKIASILCFLLALGIYPSVAEMMIICFCLRYIITPLKHKKDLLPNFVPLLAALLAFKLMLLILGKLGIIYSGHYNLQTPSMTESLHRIPAIIILILDQLWTSLPFIPQSYKITAVILLALAIINTPQKWLWWGIAIAVTALSSFLTAVPEETAYMPRINFYGLNFLIAGAGATVLQAKKKCYRNFGIAFCVLLIWGGIKSDIEATKVWHFGTIAENALVERISSVIEQKSPETMLVPVVAGELSLRPRYYATPYQKESPYILNGSLMVRHIPSGMFNFYAPLPLFYNFSQINDMTPELYEFIKKAHHQWPAQDALYIDDRYAVILLTPKGISAIQAQLPY